MTPGLLGFVQAVSATAALACGVFFFRFWRESRDELFAFFGVAFLLLAVQWSLLGLFSPTEETRPYIYVIRLIAFLLIIIAIVRKNRGALR